MEPCLRLVEVVRLLENSVGSQRQIEEKERETTRKTKGREKVMGVWWWVLIGLCWIPPGHRWPSDSHWDPILKVTVLFRADPLLCLSPSWNPWSMVSGPGLCLTALCLNNLLWNCLFISRNPCKIHYLKTSLKRFKLLLIVEMVEDLNKWNENNWWMTDECLSLTWKWGLEDESYLFL